MADLADQIFQENIKSIKKQISELIEFKTLTEAKVNNIDERLKRIETMINQLQSNIIGKVGSYGENLENIREEMDMVQESFKKIIGGEVKKRKAKSSKKPEKKSHKKRKKSKKKSKSNFKKKK